jgi:hypothetical protein
MLDGGVPIDVPTELVPSDYRMPNCDFTAVTDEGVFIRGERP